MQRDKGKRAEREIVNLAKSMGLASVRTWETAQSSCNSEQDIIIEDHPFQVKIRKAGMKFLYDLLKGQVLGAFVRRDRDQWLVVLPADYYLALLATIKNSSSAWTAKKD